MSNDLEQERYELQQGWGCVKVAQQIIRLCTAITDHVAESAMGDYPACKQHLQRALAAIRGQGHAPADD